MNSVVTVLLAIVPVILIVGYIIYIARQGLGEEHNIDMGRAVMGLAVLLVGILIISSLITSVTPYRFDEEDKTLYINQNVIGDRQPWDSYATDVKSVVISNGVSIGSGAFDSLTNISYLEIGSNVNIGSGAFGVTLKDYLDETITEPDAGQYVGTGNGILYLFDGSIFTYRDNNTSIGGLKSTASDAVNIVLPNTYNGTEVVTAGYRAFIDATSIERILTLPDSNFTTIGSGVFQGCTNLSLVQLPEGFTTFGSNCFHGCTSLETIDLPTTTTAISGNAFYDCSGLTEITIPSGVTSIGTYVFRGCSAITSVTFESGFAATIESTAFYSWTFYASDGVTTIDKTAAADLAGKTFEGTAAALIEVSEGEISLTPEQLQIVHLHDQELQIMLDTPAIDPLPFQPSDLLLSQEITA